MNLPLETIKIAKTIIEDVFQVKKGETVAITGDSASNRDFADALAGITYANGGIPLILWMPKAEDDGAAGEKDWPVTTLTAALSEVNVWIELNTSIILYSSIWEKAFENNKNLRYIILAESSVPSMLRTFTTFEIPTLGNFLKKVTQMCKETKKIKITSENGTDVSYETDSNYFFDYDDGDLSMPKFGTAPGYVNIVPKTGSMNGKIVFDLLMNADIYGNDRKIEFIMKDGKITEVNGTKNEAEKFRNYLAAFDDENMYKISHNMLGLNPGIQKMSGEVVEDERIWGGVDFGFGHTSPMDMPPNGQPAKSHFDGIVAKTSIFLDNVQIIDNGTICHPDLVDLANELLNH